MSLMKQKMAVADSVPEAFLKESICFRHTVRQVPLKPEVDATAAPALAAVLRESRDGMRNFFPRGMQPENIGSKPRAPAAAEGSVWGSKQGWALLFPLG